MGTVLEDVVQSVECLPSTRDTRFILSFANNKIKNQAHPLVRSGTCLEKSLEKGTPDPGRRPAGTPCRLLGRDTLGARRL